MTTADIATDNGIRTPEDLAKLNSQQLINLWNSLPGVTPVKKFTSNAKARARIWKQAMGAPLPALAVAKGDKPVKAPKEKKAKKAKAPKAPKAKGNNPDRMMKKAEAIRLLQRQRGVTLAELCEALSWQKHTVRGFISILGNKAKGGQKVESFKTDAGVRTYRIAS